MLPPSDIQLLPSQKRIQRLYYDTGDGIAVFLCVSFSTLSQLARQMNRDFFGIVRAFGKVWLVIHGVPFGWFN